jgi:rubrerythrin/uncharacterized damage-inducible protein DinB
VVCLEVQQDACAIGSKDRFRAEPDFFDNPFQDQRRVVTMDSDLFQTMSSKLQVYSRAHIRNLVAAEKAVLTGQFNAAKVLRAAAHTQRVLAMNIARLSGKPDTGELLETIIQEVEIGKAAQDPAPVPPDSIGEMRNRFEQFKVVEDRLKDILSRSLASLKDNRDVLESDVQQFIWGCYSCGYLVEGDLTDVCPVCGALDIEFELFGPFYSSTPEHLGQRTPKEIVSILEQIPAEVGKLIGGRDDLLLSRRPSQEEWCVKEIVGHMIEVDRLFLKRVQTIMETQGLPNLPTTAPPWKLHEGKDYENWEASQLITLLKENRDATLAFVSKLKEEDWTRFGSNQGSPVSLLDLGTWLTNHDVGHVAQIKRYIKAEEEEEAGSC